MLNSVSIMGRLTADPDVKTTNSGTTFCNFTVAVDRDYTSKDTGERSADFINCTAWRGTADFIGKYFKKGSMAVVTGRLEIRKYTDKDGNKRTAAEVNVTSIYFGSSKSGNSEKQTEPKTDENGFVVIDDSEEGFPF